MAAKDLKFSDEARARLKEGIDTLADTLSLSLSLSNEWGTGPPKLTQDAQPVGTSVLTSSSTTPKRLAV